MLSSVASVIASFSVSLSPRVPKKPQEVSGTLFLATRVVEKRKFTFLVAQKSSGVGFVGPNWPTLDHLSISQSILWPEGWDKLNDKPVSTCL